ncbi:tyrosine recombinase XerC [Maridesulfovibrio ferrireducens]|uniref:tyrosine recombinase XerC n=1 Tax=Maridesulfovibrio ferrireducens TaxID=246191 RepID=UPI001A2A5381|nr:tyrosine recombinase XerC [Maridesulfovibrio ferrireducens]MBI9112961.1 tyrosine recombinase XerC [Maridesulfovibrio ferrireducens]
MSSTAGPRNVMPEAVQIFLTHMDIEKGSSKATLCSYEKDLIQFEEFLSTRSHSLSNLVEISVDHVRGFLAKLHGRKLAKSTLSRKLSTLRSFFKYMTRHRFITNDPMAGIRNPKQEIRQPRSLNVDQAVSLLDSKCGVEPEDKRDQAIAELLYGSGLRVSEAIFLGIYDVDTSSGLVRVTGKGNKERLSPLSDTAREAIDSYLAVREELGPALEETALFVGNRGGRINRRQVNRILARMAEEAGLQGGVHPHMLRHSFASHMLQSGADMRSVQELLGHENLTTTQRYTHLNLQHIMNVYDKAHPLSESGSLSRKSDGSDE